MKKILILTVFAVLISAGLILAGCNNGIKDEVKPSIILEGQGQVFLTVGSIYEEMGCRATDDSDGDITSRVIVDYSELDLKTPGIYQIYYRVRDNSGNIAEVMVRTVIVGNNFAPEILLNPANPMVVEVGTPFVEPGFSAKDLDGNDISDQVVSNAEAVVNIENAGTYVIQYRVSDAIGQTSVITRTVYVVYGDTPMIALSGVGQSFDDPFSFEKDDTVFADKDPGWVAFDKSDGDISHLVQVNYLFENDDFDADTFPNKLEEDILPNGKVAADYDGFTYRVEYIVIDSDGNSSAAVYRYCNIVRDTTAPILSLNGQDLIFVEVDQSINNYIESGVSVNDNLWGSAKVVTDDYSDIDGNEIVFDDITLDPMVINKDHSEFPDGYQIGYYAVDAAGNRSPTVYRTVIVQDTIDPVIQASGVIVAYGNEATVLPTVVDNSGESLNASLFSGSYNSRIVGEYVVTYRATDRSANTATIDVTVSVNAPLAPAITNPGFEADAANVTGWTWDVIYDIFADGWSSGDSRTPTNPGTDAAQIASGGATSNVVLGIPITVDYSYNCTYLSGGYSGAKSATFKPSAWVDNNGAIDAWHQETYGKLYQSGFSVFKDVKYSVSAMMYAATSSRCSLVIDGPMEFDTDGDGNADVSVGENFATNPSASGSWVLVTGDFIPLSDGSIEIIFDKNKASTDDGGLSIDDVSISVVEYPEVP